MIMDNKINYISPFYNNPLLNAIVGECPCCGKKIYQREEFVKVGLNTYLHFDCWWTVRDFMKDVIAEYF